MSSFKRSAVFSALIAVMFLSSCGFVPLAGVATTQTGEGPAVQVTDLSIAGADSSFQYNVRRYLAQRVGVREDASESIALSIAVEEQSLNIRQNDTVTRRNITAVVTYSISDSDNEVVATGELTSATAINATTEFFATRASSREAERLLAIDIGRKVYALLLARQSLTPNG